MGIEKGSGVLSGNFAFDYLIFGKLADLEATRPAATHPNKLAYVTQKTKLGPFTTEHNGPYFSDGVSWKLTPLKVEFLDTNYKLRDDGDNSKEFQFELSGINTSTLAIIPITTPSTLPTLETNIQLKTSALPAYKIGQLSYDPSSLTGVLDTGLTGVRVQIGQETHWLVVNKTASPIVDGTPVYADDVDVTTNLISIAPARADDPFMSLSTLGLATLTIPVDGFGLVSKFGKVRDINTNSLSLAGVVYLAATGGTTNVFPLFPNQVILLGTATKIGISDGIIDVDVNRYFRPIAGKSYSFTSNGIGAGIYYIGGFYESSAGDVTLDQVSSTATHGIANNPYAAHGFAVFGGVGVVVGGGQVGLRINGNSINDAGVLTPGDSEDITDDITSVILNDYLETPKKWVGQIQYELYVVSGTPTSYTVAFNYGYAKYEDANNLDFTIHGIEAVGLAGAVDTNFNIRLLHHKKTGWIYSAGSFSPGDGVIAEYSADMAPYDNLANTENFAWKRDNLSTFINGKADEGVIVEITTGANNSVQAMDVHFFAYIEGF